MQAVCFVLFHELAHWLYRTPDNEALCDQFAARLGLRLGFSRYEMLAALAKTMIGYGRGHENAARARTLLQTLKTHNAYQANALL